MSERLRLTLVLLLCVPATASTQGTAIEHGGVACVVAGQFPRIDARIGQAEQVARVRAFFHADDDSRWYFVEMKAVEGVFQGVLPKPLKTTKRLHYYIETTDKGMAQNRTAEYVPEVVAEAGACSKKDAVAALAIATKIAVAAPSGASAVPAGFATSSVATAGGIGTAALVIGGIAVAGGAAAAVAVKAGSEGDGPASNQNQDTSVFVVEAFVYNDTCCPTGPVDPTIPRTGRRIQGALVSTSLDSATTTTDDRGFFRLTTQTRCQGTSPTYTLRIVASGCDPMSETRNWGCVSFGAPGGVPHALNLACR